MDFWRKWNVCCVMFTGGCLLAGNFFPEVKDDTEILIWIGGGGLAIGIIAQYLLKTTSKRK